MSKNIFMLIWGTFQKLSVAVQAVFTRLSMGSNGRAMHIHISQKQHILWVFVQDVNVGSSF